MSQETLPVPSNTLPVLTFTQEQVDLIKRTVCKGATDDELALFLYTCKRVGLDPLIRQIHAVKRWDSKLEKEVMAIQSGIDGYRLIAERTKKYAPGREATYQYDDKGAIISATAYVKKLTDDGTWHEVSATAFYAEFVQTKKDGNPNVMWAKMPHSQLAKCAEALALRRAFPNETSGVRTEDEMGQADNPGEATPPARTISEPKPKVTSAGGMTGKIEGAAPLSMSFVPAAGSAKPVSGGKTRYAIKTPDDKWLSTFDDNVGAILKKAHAEKKELFVLYVVEGEYMNIKDASIKEA